MDETHRSDLRELNENNFERFDAKLKQRRRIAELLADMIVGFKNADFDGFEERMTRKFFWYFMSQGIANAVIILGGLKLLHKLP